MAMQTSGSDQPRRRSKAWIYYGLIALGCFLGGFAHPIGFLGTLLAGAYAYYLYQGGTVVIWFW
jgi:hypothetical protein